MEKKNKSKIWVLNTSGVNRLLARMATKVEKTHCLDCVEIRKSIEHQHSPLFAAGLWIPCDQLPHAPASIPSISGRTVT